MSVTNEKYSYVIYMGAPVWVQPLKNTLKLVKGYDETHEGLNYTMLEGSFFLSGSNFDTLISLIGTDLDFEIYENAIFDENGDFVSGTAIYQGVIGSYNDPDFNQKTIELKDFSKYYEGGAATKIILQRLKTIESLNHEEGNLYDAGGTLLGTGGGEFIATHNNYHLGSLITVDYANIWYNAANATIDISKLLVIPLGWISMFGSSDANKISLERILEIMKILFRAYWYGSGGKLKFKTPKDFCVNSLDVTQYTINKKRKYYTHPDKPYIEKINFHPNNYVNKTNESNGGGIEFNDDNIVKYNNESDKVNSYDVTEICTSIYKDESLSDDYTTDGFFLGYFNRSNNRLYRTTGLRYAGLVDNNELSQSNLMYNNYQDYLSNKDDSYTVCGLTGASPTRYMPSIKLPDVELVIDPVNFYDSLIYEVTETTQLIARVVKQSTDLSTNMTTFESYEFENRPL